MVAAWQFMVTDPLARRRCFGRSITIRDRTLVLSCVFEFLAKILPFQGSERTLRYSTAQKRFNIFATAIRWHWQSWPQDFGEFIDCSLYRDADVLPEGRPLDYILVHPWFWGCMLRDMPTLSVGLLRSHIYKILYSSTPRHPAGLFNLYVNL
jgi:hypothetical protein